MNSICRFCRKRAKSLVPVLDSNTDKESGELSLRHKIDACLPVKVHKISFFFLKHEPKFFSHLFIL